MLPPVLGRGVGNARVADGRVAAMESQGEVSVSARICTYVCDLHMEHENSSGLPEMTTVQKTGRPACLPPASLDP